MSQEYPTFTIVADIEDAKQVARWGTYGKSGSDPLKWKKLIDCETEHLEAILRTQPHIKQYSGLKEIIESILEDRKNPKPPEVKPKAKRKKKEPFDPFQL